MRTVSVIGFDGALASAITGIIDLFRLAGVTWARINDLPPEQEFTTRLLTEGGEQVYQRVNTACGRGLAGLPCRPFAGGSCDCADHWGADWAGIGS